MNDKLQQLYDLYKQKGIINTTDFNTFAAASDDQRQKLYDLGVQKGLFNTTDFNTFNTAWSGGKQEPLKKKESTELASKSEKPTSVSSTKKDDFYKGGLGEAPKKPKEIERPSDVYVGFPGKEKNEYRVDDGTWQRRQPGKTQWTTITNEGSINALNKQFNKTVKPMAETEKAQVENQAKRNSELEQRLNQVVTGSLVSQDELALRFSSDDEVAKRLKQSFPDFKFTAKGGMSDRITVTAPTGATMEIQLDNWSWDDDKKEAEGLKTFIRANSFTDAEKASKKLDSIKSQRDKEIDVATNKLAAEGLMDRTQKFLENPLAPQDPMALVKQTPVAKKEEQAISQKYQAPIKKAEEEYVKEKAEQFKDVYEMIRIDKSIDPKQAYASIRRDDRDIKIIGDFYNSVQKSAFDLDKKQKEEQARINSLAEKVKTGELTMEEYDAIVEESNASLAADAKKVAADLKSVSTASRALDKSIGMNYVIEESRGSFGGGMAYKFVEGATSIPRLLSFGDMSKEDQDELVKAITGGDTSTQYVESEKRGDFSKAMFSLAESLGVMASSGALVGIGAAARYAGFYGMSYYEMKDQLDAAQFKNKETGEIEKIPERDKVLLSAGYGILSSVLENFGVDMALSKTAFGRNLSNNIMKRAFLGLSKDATEAEIRAAINASVGNVLSEIGVKAGIGAAAEALTEASQSLSQVGIEEVYDEYKNKDFSKNKGLQEALSNAAYEGYLGAIGGGVMSIAQSSPQALKIGFNAVYKQEELEALINATKIEGINSALVNKLKADLLTGKMSKEEAKSVIESFNNIQGKVRSIPDNLSAEAKSESLELMAEREKIEKEIEGKDPNLVKPQTERISEINNRLQEIAKENAVQEQSTGEIPVQPETGVSGEVAQGVSQPKTEGVTGETVREEVKVEEPQAEVAKEEIVQSEENQSLIDAYVKQETEFINNSTLLNQEQKQQTIQELENDPVAFAERNSGLTEIEGDTPHTDFLNSLQRKSVAQETAVAEETAAPAQPEVAKEEVVQPSEEDNSFVYKMNTERTSRGKGKWEDDFEIIDNRNGLELGEEASKWAVVNKITGEIVEAKSKKDAQDIVKNAPAYGDMFGDGMTVDFTELNEQSQNKYREQFNQQKNKVQETVAPEVVQETVQPEAQPAIDIEVQEAVPVEDSVDEITRLNNVLTENDFTTARVRNVGKEKVIAQINKAAKAIAKVLPKVKFQVHSTGADFVNATKSIDGRLSDGGLYDHQTKTIHINLEKANNRTVAHEVFHALLLSRVSSDIEAQRLTRSMVRSVLKSLKKAEGTTDLINYLEDFESNYDENIKNEEKLAELFAVLADNYKQLPEASKNVIIRFLNRIAKALGLKQMTDREAVQFMNTLARKVESGEQITAEEVGKTKEGKVSARKQKADVIKSKIDEDWEHTITLNGKEIGKIFYDKSQKTWNNVDFDRRSVGPYSTKWIYGDVVGENKKEAIDEMVRRYKEKEALREVKTEKTEEAKIKYTNDQVTNNFLNALNEKSDVSKNPIDNRSFIYGDKAFLELSRFDKGDRNEIAIQSISTFDKGKGVGKQVMKDITDTADELSVTLTLDAKPFGNEGLSKEQLINFYKKNGFVADVEEMFGGEFESEEELIDYVINEEPDAALQMTRKPSARQFAVRKQKLAPNGKPSNLNDKQWEQVRTPEFKAWFGDWENDPENASKVVDENGEPLVMYHGSPSVNIESFDINKGIREKSGLKEFANYFTSNKKLADLYRKAPLSKEYENEIKNLLSEAKEKQYESRSNATWDFYSQEIDRLNSIFEGKIYEVFLNVKYPFEFNGDNLDMKGWNNASLNIGYKTATGKAAVIEALSGNNSAYKNTEYDGLIATNLADMFYGTNNKEETRESVKNLTGTIVAIWNPNQIKSATENVGTFSEKEFSIRKQKTTGPSGIVENGVKAGKTDAEIRQEGRAAGFTNEEMTEALSKYYIKEQGIFMKSDAKGFAARFVDAAKKFKQKYLTSKGLLAKIGFTYKERMEGEISAEANRAAKTAKKFSVMFDKFTGDKELLRKAFDKVLRGDKSIQLPTGFARLANEMRNHIDRLSQMLIDSGAVEGEMAEIVRNNLGTYLSRSYEIFDNKNFRQKVGEQELQAAKNFLRTQPGMIELAKSEAQKTNVTVDKALDILVNNRINEYFADAEIGALIKGSKLGSKDLSTLKKREDIPEQIRMLMGEYTDPAMNYARTVLNIANLAAKHKFLTDVKKAGMGKFFFESGDTQRPKGFDFEIAPSGSETMSPLNGLKTTKEIAEAFMLYDGKNSDTNRLMKFYMKAMSMVKWLKTIASVGTHMKNVFSNTGFVAANGHSLSEIAKAAKVVSQDLKTMSKPEIEAKIDEYIRAGVMRQSAGINEIRSMFKDADMDDFLERRLSMKPTRGMFDKVKRAISSRGSKIKTGLEELYQAEDDVFKIAAYETELKRYADALYDKPFKDLTDDQKAEVSEIAANNVKNTYPTNSRIPEGIKLMRRYPLFVGSFISFQAESYRTAYNTISLAKQELSSKNEKVKAIGARRLFGTLTYLSAKTAILSYAGYAAKTGLSGVIGYLFDDDDEKEKEKDVRSFLPPWSKNSDIIILKAADGTIDYIDFSASDPHGGLNKALNAFLQGEDLLDKFKQSTLELVGQFAGPDITTKLLLDLRANKNDFDKEIYNPEDDFANKTSKILDYVYKVVEPGTFTSIRKLAESDQPAGQLAFGEATGLKIRNVNVKDQFGYKLSEFDKSFGDIKRKYNTEYYKTERMLEDSNVSTKEFKTQEDVTEKALEKSNKLFTEKAKELMSLINSANRMGVDYDELIDQLKTMKNLSKSNVYEMEDEGDEFINEK